MELVTSCLERIEDLNPTLNAVVTVARESALVEAQRAEKDLLQGLDEGILHGCLLYTSPSPRDRTRSRMPSSA